MSTNIFLFTPSIARHDESCNADYYRFNDARMHFRDHDRLFERYMDNPGLGSLGRSVGLEMRGKQKPCYARMAVED